MFIKDVKNKASISYFFFSTEEPNMRKGRDLRVLAGNKSTVEENENKNEKQDSGM